MKVYVLTEHWWPESYGPPQSTTRGVYSNQSDAESRKNELLSEVDWEDQCVANGYDITVQEFTINKHYSDED